MKKYYLYRQRPFDEKEEWAFDGEFSSYEEAFNIAKERSEISCFKVWKIKEVLDFTI